jgi:hypothetical protein
VEYFGGTEIARVPQLIAAGKPGEDGVVEKAVRVGEKPNAQISSYGQGK